MEKTDLAIAFSQQLSRSTKCQVKIIEHGLDFDASLKEAFRIAQTEGRSLVHPYDDPLVIAGNGTIGMEILKEVCCCFSCKYRAALKLTNAC